MFYPNGEERGEEKLGWVLYFSSTIYVKEKKHLNGFSTNKRSNICSSVGKKKVKFKREKLS